MTTLVERMEEYYASIGRAPCASGRVYIPKDRTAEQLYNATSRPELWMIVLAVVNPVVAGATAVALLQSFQDEASGEFLSDLLSVTGLSYDWLERRTRTKKRDRGVGAKCTLQNGYLHLLEYLRTKDPRAMQGIGEALVECDVRCNSRTITEARAVLYTALRGEVDEATFMGEYT